MTLPRAIRIIVVLLGLAAQTALAEQPDVFPLDQVREGLQGYGLSVFSGDQPERFEVEVIGVWRNVRPGLSYILARLSGQGLEESGVVDGMSGSPVYFDDRPAGAVAFSWSFAKQAIAGITPLESMRELLEIEAAEFESGTAQTDFELEQIASREVSPEHLEKALALLSKEATAGGSTGLAWMVSGFGESSRSFLAGSLGGLASAGRTGGPVPPVVPGGSIAAVLVDGDLRMAATGTVTDRVDNSILAFGHAFLGGGEVDLPMASAEVVTVMPSQLSSFKIANLGPIVGAFDFDHETGIRGVLGAHASMIPLSIDLTGGGRDHLELRLADVPAITPVLLAISLLGGLDTADQAVGSRGLDVVARFDLGPNGQLELEQTFDGDASANEAAVYLMAVTSYLLQNRLAKVELSSIELEVARHHEPRALQLLGAHANRTLVEPGELVTLNFDLAEYRGGMRRQSVQVELPPDLSAGRYSFLVGDGPSIDSARLTIEKTDPVTFEQALGFLDSLHSSRDLVVAGVISSKGLGVAGEVLPQLPGSVMSLWKSAGSTSARPLQLAVIQQESVRLLEPIEGAARVDLEIKKKFAISGEGNEQ